MRRDPHVDVRLRDLSDWELEEELTLAALAEYRTERFRKLLEEHDRRRSASGDERSKLVS